MSTTIRPVGSSARDRHPLPRRKLVDRDIVGRALVDSVRKLNPRQQARNPVMFVVLVGSVLTTILFLRDLGDSSSADNVFSALIAAFLWFTVLFANFAEAMAEGRGKAQAATLRQTRQDTMARRRDADGTVEAISSSALRVGDECVVTAGEVIPSDGDVVEGIATVDESAITGESAPVIRESGGDRSAVTGGTRVLSDEIVVRITARPGETFLDRMIALVEGAERQKTPNEIALNILLSGLTIVFLLAVVTLQPFAIYAGDEQSIVVLVALLVCLIPTTIGALLSAIGIAGMDRLVQRNVLAMSGRAVEAAGDVNTLLLDKTGTITHGNRQAAEFIPLPGVRLEELVAAAHRSSLADETPEGRSIVALAESEYGEVRMPLSAVTLVPFTAQTRMSGIDVKVGANEQGIGERSMTRDVPSGDEGSAVSRGVLSGDEGSAVSRGVLSGDEGSAVSRGVLTGDEGSASDESQAARGGSEADDEPAMRGGSEADDEPAMSEGSEADDEPAMSIRKGATDAVKRWVVDSGGTVPTSLDTIAHGISGDGGTPLAVAERDGATDTCRALGVIHLKDVVKDGIKERFDQLRAMGVRTVMVTGDNPLTARAIAGEAGVDDFLAEATPEDKMALIKREQSGGRLIAMTGDGTNDAPALAQADVGVAMNTGTQAAKEAGNMVDLDSDPTKLIEIVEIGKQLLITRGALTTFSVANDVAKYFAIIPAMFMGVFPVLDDINVMRLGSPRSAILSAVVFNALVIVALIPLALRGVKFRAEGAAAMLRRNLLIYGLGGLVAPFVGIKLIDLLLSALGVS